MENVNRRMKISGVVSDYSPGQWGVPGIKIIGDKWRNAPKGSWLLSEDLKGQRVEIVLEDLYGDGESWIVEVKPESEQARKLDVKKLVDGSAANQSRAMFSEFLAFFIPAKEYFVPKGELDGYVKDIKEKQAVDVSLRMWEQFRNEQLMLKQKLLNDKVDCEK